MTSTALFTRFIRWLVSIRWRRNELTRWVASVGWGFLLVSLLTQCSQPDSERGKSAIPEYQLFEQYEPLPGQLRIGPEPERAINLGFKGYSLLLVNGVPEIRGVVLFLQGTRVDLRTIAGTSIEAAALKRNLGVLHLSTGNPLDFYFSEDTMQEVADSLQALLAQHELQHAPLFFAGLSLGGTRALKLAVFLIKNNQQYWARPTAVAIVDAPLDMIRFWAAEVSAIRANFHAAASDEGRWVTYLLEENLGGPPTDNFEAYEAYSPFVDSAPDGGNAIYLRDIAVRAYHEPDVDWWIENRRKSYYSMNSIDQAALINELKLQGNTRAELITTHQKRQGFSRGSSPHTWSIVDNEELVAWFIEQVDSAR